MMLFRRISPSKIISNHFETLYDEGQEGEVNFWSEIVPLLLIATFIALVLIIYFKITINEKVITYFIGAFSVVGGFLINALMVLAEKRGDNSGAGASSTKDKLLRETFYNTSFGVLICLVINLLCILYPLFDSLKWQELMSGVIYFLTTLFFHTLLMVVKRINKVFE